MRRLRGSEHGNRLQHWYLIRYTLLRYRYTALLEIFTIFTDRGTYLPRSLLPILYRGIYPSSEISNSSPR